MGAFKAESRSRAEDKYSFAEVMALFVGGIIIGAVFSCMLYGVYSSSEDITTLVIDKGIDIGIAVFVSVFFVCRFEYRKRTRENIIQFMRSSKEHFERGIRSQQGDVEDITAFITFALGNLAEAKRLMRALKMKKNAKSVDDLCFKLNEAPELRRFLVTGKVIDGFQDECTNILTLYAEIICGIS